jgi:hypothetical protein
MATDGLLTVRYGDTIAVRGSVRGDSSITRVSVGHGGMVEPVGVDGNGRFELELEVRDVTAANVDVRATSCAGRKLHAWQPLGIVGTRRLYLSIDKSSFVIHKATRQAGVLNRAMLLKSRFAVEEPVGRWRKLRVELLGGQDRTVADLYVDDPLIAEQETESPLKVEARVLDRAQVALAIPDHPDARAVRLTRFGPEPGEKLLGKAVLP